METENKELERMKKQKYIIVLALMPIIFHANSHSAVKPKLSIQAEYGFTSGIDLHKPGGMAAARRMIDRLSSHDIRWLRMSLNINVKLYQNPKKITFNEYEWKPYIELYEYARSRNMKTIITTYPAYELAQQKLATNEFLQSVKYQYKRLTLSFPQADVWQIYNEANTHHKDDYLSVCRFEEFACIGNVPTRLPADYMNSLYQTIAIAREAIKEISPNSKITTNAENGSAHSIEYMQRLKRTLDIYSFDLYPDDYDHSRNFPRLKNNLSLLKREFGDGLWIAETGRPSAQGNCTYRMSDARKQHLFLLDLIPAIAELGIRNVNLYEYQDKDIDWYSECEKHFGITDKRGIDKPASPSILKLTQLYSYMPLNAQTETSSKGLKALFNSFQDSFGRAPTLWEAYGISYDGWLATIIDKNLTYESLNLEHENWLMSQPGADERKAVVSRSYQVAFGRPPKAEETKWANANFRNYRSILNSHMNWIGSYNGRAERIDIVRRSYKAVLNREPISSEISEWLSIPPKTYAELIEEHRNWMDYNVN